MHSIKSKQPTGMVAFTIVWIGQLVSMLATLMTQFALTLWVFQETGSATALGLMQVFFITPFLLMSPIAGVLVDRHNRKLMMMLSDLGAGLGTVLILVLHSLGMLEVWHLYLVSAIAGTFQVFQWPAYSAAITTMVSKEHYGRANGMMSVVEAGPGIIAPLMAGALIAVIGLQGILLLDVATFVLAIGALLAVHVPQPAATEEGTRARGSILKEAAFGFKYIFARPSLLGLQLVFLFGNLFAGIGMTLFAPMILARTGNSELTLASVMSAGAVSSVLGGVAMGAWGGFKRKVHGVLFGWLLSTLGGTVVLAVGQNPLWWIIGSVFASFFIPIINGSNQVIWQTKVAPDLQGRVFSARRLIAWITQPIAPLIGGTLADFVMEPAMLGRGMAVAVFGPLVGVGPGAGMAAILLVTSLLIVVVVLVAYTSPAVRHAETLLPDHDAAPATATAAAD